MEVFIAQNAGFILWILGGVLAVAGFFIVMWINGITQAQRDIVQTQKELSNNQKSLSEYIASVVKDFYEKYTCLAEKVARLEGENEGRFDK